MTRAFIGLGANLGDRLATLSRALDAIGELPDTRVAAVSDAVESEPWGVADQPPFANAVALVETSLTPDGLLDGLQRIESTLGRVRTVRNGPRTIDLDILLFGETRIDTPRLTVPHPRLAERAFVVEPLLALAPGVRLPDGTPITRDGARAGRVTGLLGPVPGYGRADAAPASGGCADGRCTGGVSGCTF